MMTFRLRFISFILLLVSMEVSATDITGPIQILRSVNPSNGGPGRTLVMITGAATTCIPNNWYAFENGDTGIGKVWTSFLLTAYSLGKDVTIIGDGICHGYSDLEPGVTLEGVRRVELK